MADRPTTMDKSSSVRGEQEDVLFTSEEVRAIVERATKAATREFENAYNEKLAKLQNEVIGLKTEVLDLKTTVAKLKIHQNHLEQYSRRSHLRIYGLKLSKTESCKETVAAFINAKLSGNSCPTISPNDLDAAHPLPIRSKPTPPPSDSQPSTNSASSASKLNPPTPVVIVRFHQREIRDAVIRSRRALKSTQWKIQEDLTKENANLLNRLSNAPAVKSAWSWEGKIFASLHGVKKPQRFDILDEL